MGKFSRFSPTAILSAFWTFFAVSFRSRAVLQIEILALRHQLNAPALRQTATPQRRRPLVLGLVNWSAWRGSLKMVNPATGTAWHYKGFRLFWTWKSRHGQPVRPAVSLKVLQLIRRMSRENRFGDLPRSTASAQSGFRNQRNQRKYLVRRKGPPSQSWLDLSGIGNCRPPVFAGVPVNPSTHIADIEFFIEARTRGYSKLDSFDCCSGSA
jgi:hypothetical protein